MRRTPRSPAPAFTLIEMLAVVGILSVVIAIAVPAFQSLGRANALSSAGNSTANLVAAARQNSTSRNVLTALVVLTGTGTEADFRTFGRYERGVNGSWLQVGVWETLPVGVVVDPEERINCSFLDNSPTRPALTDPDGSPSVRFGERAVDSTSMAFRVFLPTGSLSNPEQPAQLRLVEGTIEGFGENRTVRYARRTTEGTPNFYDVAIIGATGATKIIRP
jgi:prepilin-type N-terminal cleavage/methylation domain-containing protein